MMNGIDKRTEREIETLALLDIFPHLDVQDYRFKDKPLKQILEQMEGENEVKATSRKDFEVLKAAVKEDEALGNYILVDQSAWNKPKTGKKGIAPELLIAATFEDPIRGDIYMTYRGTGDGKWVDNGDALTKEGSKMQWAALYYLNSVFGELGLSSLHEEGKRFIVGGHSKGGNSSQFAALKSPYRKFIDAVYSLEGQGFSKEAVESFKNREESVKGDSEYQKQLDKMYSISGDCDYVSPLGISVIPKGHTYITEKMDFVDPAAWHGLASMLEGNHIRWERDREGNILHGNRVLPGILAENASKRIMSMPPEYIDSTAVSIMSILEATLPYGEDGWGGEHKEGTGDRKFVTPSELRKFVQKVLPVLATGAIKESWDYVHGNTLPLADLDAENLPAAEWEKHRIDKLYYAASKKLIPEYMPDEYGDMVKTDTAFRKNVLSYIDIPKSKILVSQEQRIVEAASELKRDEEIRNTLMSKIQPLPDNLPIMADREKMTNDAIGKYIRDNPGEVALMWSNEKLQAPYDPQKEKYALQIQKPKADGKRRKKDA